MWIRGFVIGVLGFCLVLAQPLSDSQLMEGLRAHLLAGDSPEIAAEDINEMQLSSTTFSARSDLSHIYTNQTVHGIRVHNAIMTASMKQDGSVLNLIHRFHDRRLLNIGDEQAGLSGTDALAAASRILGYVGALDDLSVQTTAGAELRHDFVAANFSVEPIAAYLNYLRIEDELRVVWVVEVLPVDSVDWWQLLIDANSGEELTRFNWTVHDSFTGGFVSETDRQMKAQRVIESKQSSNSYYVLEMPVESPNHGAFTNALDPFDLMASPFGWHDTDGAIGAEFTTTQGNNVHAYQDRDGNDLPSGDDPDGGPGLVFSVVPDFGMQPNTYTDAATINLFYWNNMVHDLLNNLGFDAASGNFQENNYGAGAAGLDSVNAQSQSRADQPSSSTTRNNANFSTPGDGGNPRMRMYEWEPAAAYVVNVTEPGIIAGAYFAGGAAFGGTVPMGGIAGELVLVDDGVGTTSDGCEVLVNGAEISGKIAVIDRGGCNFTLKVKNAQDAGAILAIVVNNAPNGIQQMGGTDPTVVIPGVFMSMADGQLIKDQLALSQTVMANILNNDAEVNRDSDFDSGIIAHEYGHGVSNRLTGGRLNVSCLQNEEQMGEGWSDFIGLYMTATAAHEEGTIRGVGTYASFQPVDGYGIRPRPYSTDFFINELTYANRADANIAIPHGVGFLWCTMLWDMYWPLVNQYGFDPDLINGTGGNNLAMQLVLEGMKIQPCSPGMVDGRDAILAADVAINGTANRCDIWRAFARRGLGFSASQGSSGLIADGSEAFDLPCDCGPFYHNPEGVEVCAGEDVTFSIEIAGTGWTLQWMKDGVDIMGETSPDLTLLAVAGSDSASYTCRAMGGCGPDYVSTPAVLVVNVVVYSTPVAATWLTPTVCGDALGNGIVDIADLVLAVNEI